MQALIQQLPLSSILALLLGVLPAIAGYVAAYVAGYLRSDTFNRYVNAIIAGVVILIFAALSIVIADAVAGQWSFSLQAIQASVVMLAFGQMKPLMLSIQDVVGFTSTGFVLLPPAKGVPSTADRTLTVEMPIARVSSAVQPARKVNLSAIQPTKEDHAG